MASDGAPGRTRNLLRPPRFHRAKTAHDVMALPQRTPSKQQRDPPPSLFLHPSPAASHVSLPGILGPGASAPGGPSTLNKERPTLERGTSGLSPNDGQRLHRAFKSTESTRSADRTDALWAEMQATLQEVELSASGGTHVFGPDHDRKLGDLRAAQIALAQAWARSEADDTIETVLRDDLSTSGAGDELGTVKTALGDATKSGAGEGTDAAKSTAASNSARPDSLGGGVERPRLEEDTEADIRLARRRREANDQYFQRVNNGVIDVITKLEDVAVAMRAVEQESQDVWNESELATASGKSLLT